jgi:hypothetical protein
MPDNPTQLPPSSLPTSAPQKVDWLKAGHNIKNVIFYAVGIASALFILVFQVLHYWKEIDAILHPTKPMVEGFIVADMMDPVRLSLRTGDTEARQVAIEATGGFSFPDPGGLLRLRLEALPEQSVRVILRRAEGGWKSVQVSGPPEIQ